jgi:hypothetical protein
MNVRITILGLIICTVTACNGPTKKEQGYFKKALENGFLANEGYTRCLNFTKDWLSVVDPRSGLIPSNAYGKGLDTWTPHNAAADNYPFMVLTAYLLDEEMYEGTMLNILNTEKKITSRLGALPDTYSFTEQNFKNKEIDTAKIIFGTSEYIKDGLIPLTEYIGFTPWSERLIEMLDDLSKHITVVQMKEGTFYSNSISTEINGELLQTLSRIYWMTKDKKYLDWATSIADYYLLDHPDYLLKNNRMRLRDHGCEIIGGLSEFYIISKFTNSKNHKAYQKNLHKILDRILEVGRNEDGMFYNAVNMETGVVSDHGIVDNWGYLYNAYYTVYLIDRNVEYRDAVLKVFKALGPNYSNFDWERGSSDGFADAIESGINLYNRERVPELKKWIDNEIKVMWSLQDSSYRKAAQPWKNRGIIEGWHGDGNFARTTIMYCLMQTNDATVSPWREDIILGTIEKEDKLYISLKANEDWEGTLYFGRERHKEIFHLPIDYPRINQFPEWFTIKDEETYLVTDFDTNSATSYDGLVLRDGIKVKLKKSKPFYLRISRKR